MTDANELLLDGFGRVSGIVHRTVSGLNERALTFRPEGQGNTIAWLIWHLTRIQDDHLAELREQAQVWTADGWYTKFNLPFDEGGTGYGHSDSDVAAVRTDAKLLIAYFDAVNAETIKFVKTIKPADYDKVVDESYDPPVTVAVRLISVLSDDLQHAGQAAYVRGLLK